MGLGDELLKLEQQAAVVASYLDPDDEELLEQVADAWAPMPACGTTKGTTAAQRQRWRRQWIDWLFSCAESWEARPSEPSGDDLHRLIVGWCRRT